MLEILCFILYILKMLVRRLSSSFPKQSIRSLGKRWNHNQNDRKVIEKIVINGLETNNKNISLFHKTIHATTKIVSLGTKTIGIAILWIILVSIFIPIYNFKKNWDIYLSQFKSSAEEFIKKLEPK
jgi:hypothetical protein